MESKSPLTTCGGAVILKNNSADSRSRAINSRYGKSQARSLEVMSWTLGNGVNQELPINLIKTGTANSWVIQSRGFAKSLNVGSPPVPPHLEAQDLHYALGIGQEIRQPCPLAALCEEKSISSVLKLPQEWVVG